MRLYLVCEEPVLALLAVEWRSVVDHLGVDLHLVDEVHMVAQLLKVLATNDSVLKKKCSKFSLKKR